MKYYLFLLFIFFSNSLICQDDSKELDFLFPGDSIPTNSFMLDEVTVFQPLKFNNDEDCSFSGILKEQYRMEPKICDLVSRKGYNELRSCFIPDGKELLFYRERRNREYFTRLGPGWHDNLNMGKIGSLVYQMNCGAKFYSRNNFLELEDHIKLYKKIDLALDTFPYNGVTTTFESLWSGVPVLVMKGYNMSSRAGESILINGNSQNFIASNQDDYIKKAIYFSNNLGKLDEERKQIFDNILNTPLFDSEKFSLELQNNLLKIYNRKLPIKSL